MNNSDKNIVKRFYIVASGLFILACFVVYQLVKIQFIEGENYRQLAKQNTTKNFVIPANRGNIYADDGSLIATSVPKYDIRFDAVTVSQEDFNTHLIPLSKELSKLFDKPASYYQDKLRKARANKNRYTLIVKGLGYSNYIKVKQMPLFRLGPYKGGIIVEQHTVREHPLGRVAERLVGNQKNQEKGVYEVGFEGAFNEYLNGKNGKRLKQKIAKGQWKPVFDENEIEPQDGYDVITTINVNIQDIAHHALLKQMEYYEADHGSVIVMEVATGEIKAVANLGKSKSGGYYEKLNYAIGESHEPGSTFKVMALMAALEDKAIDTATVIDTKNGTKRFYGRNITDSKHGGYGKISAAKTLEVSSNIGLATIIDDYYKNNPQAFITHLKKWNLNQKVGVPIAGEGVPVIPEPGHDLWSKNALPSMAYGYNLRLTPLQTLTFYNAIANQGVMVKPKFVKQINKMNKPVESFNVEVLQPKICSDETLNEIKDILKNIVKRGTGKGLYSENFSMAGKTGTARTEYWLPGWEQNRKYISSFAGYFPADNPKYSCIVVIHKPSTKKGYYGADVTGPVFKRIAQKIFTDSPIIEEVNEDFVFPKVAKDYEAFIAKNNLITNKVPNVVGLQGMDAVAILENLGLKVITKGNGKVEMQSLPFGTTLKKGSLITLKLS